MSPHGAPVLHAHAKPNAFTGSNFLYNSSRSPRISSRPRRVFSGRFSLALGSWFAPWRSLDAGGRGKRGARSLGRSGDSLRGTRHAASTGSSAASTSSDVLPESVPESAASASACPAVIPRSDVPAWMERLEAKSVDSLLVKLVKHAADTYAQPPISNFRVGVAALGKSGAIYLGANIEFRNTSLGQSVHAEQFAVALMASQGEVGLNSLALTHSPCGHCRQFFQEVYGASGMRVVFPGSPAAVLSDLLPEAFTPSDLHEDPPLVMRGGNFELVASDDEGELDDLAAMALASACASHAPYTTCPSGVALRFEDGSTYSGAYYECAAYNPSLPPMQAAIVAAVAHGVSLPGGLQNDGTVKPALVDAVLCELDDAMVSQQSPTEAVLASLTIGSDVRLRMLKVNLKA
ncbi:cytidine deaminase [Pseudoscourfieldia marina]